MATTPGAHPPLPATVAIGRAVGTMRDWELVRRAAAGAALWVGTATVPADAVVPEDVDHAVVFGTGPTGAANWAWVVTLADEARPFEAPALAGWRLRPATTARVQTTHHIGVVSLARDAAAPGPVGAVNFHLPASEAPHNAVLWVSRDELRALLAELPLAVRTW